jgi:NAD dependent epimerase/dehydratase family enzyme
MVMWAMTTPSVSGPLNLTAPEPVTNAAFAHALGKTLRRPAWMPTPGFALRIVLGEMADALILGGQRVVPRAALAGGFRFAHPTLESALTTVYR